MVQLSKLDHSPQKALNADEISALWEKIDKTKLVQYKMKVDLSPDVLAIANKDTSGGKEEPSKAEAAKAAEKSSNFKQEESKEKPDLAKFKTTNYSKMEDIKEMDSEQESVKPSRQAPAAQKATDSQASSQKIKVLMEKK